MEQKNFNLDISAIKLHSAIEGFDPNRLLVKIIKAMADGIQKEFLYMPTASMTQWFYAAFPEGAIIPEVVNLTDRVAVFKANIFTDKSDEKPVSIGFVSRNFEDANPFSRSFIQNASNGAIRIALQNYGFGIPIDAKEIDGIPVIDETNVGSPDTGTNDLVPLNNPMPIPLPVPVIASEKETKTLRKKAKAVDSPKEEQKVISIAGVSESNSTSIKVSVAEPIENVEKAIEAEGKPKEKSIITLPAPIPVTITPPVHIVVATEETTEGAENCDNGEVTAMDEEVASIEEPKVEKLTSEVTMSLEEETATVVIPLGACKGQTIKECLDKGNGTTIARILKYANSHPEKFESDNGKQFVDVATRFCEVNNITVD